MSEPQRDPVLEAQAAGAAERKATLEAELQRFDERRREREAAKAARSASAPTAQASDYFQGIHAPRPTPAPPPAICETCKAEFDRKKGHERICDACVEVAQREYEERVRRHELDQCEEAAYKLSDRLLQLEGARVPRACWVDFSEPDPWPSPAEAPEFDLRAWRGEPWAVTLSGSVGVGKSCLAAEVALRWRRRFTHPDYVEQISVRWVTAAELVRLTFDRDEALPYLEAAPLVVVDDLGRNHQSEAALSAVTAFLYLRCDSTLPTLVTTNLTEAELAKLDLGLADRLLNAGHVIAMTGPSRRTAGSGGAAATGRRQGARRSVASRGWRSNADLRRAIGGHPPSMPRGGAGGAWENR